METAKIILQQLGGNQFVAMTGAKCFSDGPNTLIVRFKGSKVANHLNITLNQDDTYYIRFAKITGVSYQKVKEMGGVYCDMLRPIFEETTGLLTSLGTMGR